MDLSIVETVIERDGEINLRGLPYKRGDRVELKLVSEEDGSRQSAPLTARELLESPLVGLWRDRSDIGDTVDYARKLREAAQKRQG